MKNGEGCKNLYLLQTSNAYGAVSKRAYRCCAERQGLFLKSWRCVGQDGAECPGFQPKDQPTRDRDTHE